jgi:hypothetical protein
MQRTHISLSLFSLAFSLFLLNACGNHDKGQGALSPPQSGAAPQSANPSSAEAAGYPITDSPKDKTPAIPEKNVPEKKIVKVDWIMECKYQPKDDEKRRPPQFARCISDQRICEYNAMLAPTSTECKNHLTLACDGNTVFSGEPIHGSQSGIEFLFAKLENNTSIIISYPSEHPKTNMFNVPSGLKIGTFELEGVCEVIKRIY